MLNKNVPTGSSRISGGFQKVRLVPLCYQYLAQTDGTLNWVYYDLDLPEIANWGPHIEGILPYGMTSNGTANHTWNVVISYSFDGKVWSAWNPLFAPINSFASPGPFNAALFNNAAWFGPIIRLAIAVKSSAGAGTVVESGIVGASCGFVFRS